MNFILFLLKIKKRKKIDKNIQLQYVLLEFFPILLFSVLKWGKPFNWCGEKLNLCTLIMSIRAILRRRIIPCTGCRLYVLFEHVFFYKFFFNYFSFHLNFWIERFTYFLFFLLLDILLNLNALYMLYKYTIVDLFA